jgi:hypothetical protein
MVANVRSMTKLLSETHVAAISRSKTKPEPKPADNALGYPALRHQDWFL